MLRFVNAHGLASLGLAAAAVLVVVTLTTRVENSPTSKASAEGEPAPGASSPGPETGGDASMPAQGDDASVPPAADDRGRLGVPVDPSGARRDRSELGARQSALDFVSTVQQRLLYLTDAAALDVIEAWSADSADSAALDADIEELAALRSTLESAGGRVWWSVSPIASHVDAYENDRAQVSVWVCQIVGSSVDPTRGGDAIAPTVDFRTATIDLVWTAESGWSIWATSSVEGPVPMMSAASTMTAPMEFMDTLGNFTLVKEHS